MKIFFVSKRRGLITQGRSVISREKWMLTVRWFWKLLLWSLTNLSKGISRFKNSPFWSVYRFSPRTEFAHSQGTLARCRHKIGLFAGLILPFTSVTTFTIDSEMWWNLFVLITSSSSGSQLFIHFADGRCQTSSFSRKALIDYSFYAMFVYCHHTCFMFNNCSFSNNLVIQAWEWVGGWVSDVKRCLTRLIESGRSV